LNHQANNKHIQSNLIMSNLKEPKMSLWIGWVFESSDVTLADYYYKGIVISLLLIQGNKLSLFEITRIQLEHFLYM